MFFKNLLTYFIYASFFLSTTPLIHASAIEEAFLDLQHNCPCNYPTNESDFLFNLGCQKFAFDLKEGSGVRIIVSDDFETKEENILSHGAQVIQSVLKIAPEVTIQQAQFSYEFDNFEGVPTILNLSFIEKSFRSSFQDKVAQEYINFIYNLRDQLLSLAKMGLLIVKSADNDKKPFGYDDNSLTYSSIANMINRDPDIPGYMVFVGASQIQDNQMQYNYSNIAGIYPENYLSTPYDQFDFGEYGKSTGTSFATPTFSGLAALAWSKHPNWTAKQVMQVFMSNTHIYPPSHNLRSGVSSYLWSKEQNGTTLDDRFYRGMGTICPHRVFLQLENESENIGYTSAITEESYNIYDQNFYSYIHFCYMRDIGKLPFDRIQSLYYEFYRDVLYTPSKIDTAFHLFETYVNQMNKEAVTNSTEMGLTIQETQSKLLVLAIHEYMKPNSISQQQYTNVWAEFLNRWEVYIDSTPSREVFLQKIDCYLDILHDLCINVPKDNIYFCCIEKQYIQSMKALYNGLSIASESTSSYFPIDKSINWALPMKISWHATKLYNELQTS